MGSWIRNNCKGRAKCRIKNSMLEYLTEIMEDANDFGWQSANASHAVLLCRMEDGKVDWSETQKIDRIRRAHAQRGVTQTQGGQNSKSTKSDSRPAMACRFYQKGLCHNQRDYETGGTFYKQICANCFSVGRENRHIQKTVKCPPGIQKTNKALPEGSAQLY